MYRLKLTAVFFLMNLISAYSQEVNKLDSDGKRHGLWKGLFEESKRVRYEGVFDHGKETGIFTYYDDTKVHSVVATRDFTKGENRAYTTYFDVKKNVVSEGMLLDKKPDGKWVYYHKESKLPMTIEFYTHGVLDGKREVFYPNGKLAESTNYKNGIKDGLYQKFSDKGSLIEKVLFVGGLEEGEAVYNDASGKAVAKGIYKKGQKNGQWQFFEDGKLIRTEKHPLRKKFEKKKFK